MERRYRQQSEKYIQTGHDVIGNANGLADGEKSREYLQKIGYVLPAGTVISINTGEGFVEMTLRTSATMMCEVAEYGHAEFHSESSFRALNSDGNVVSFPPDTFAIVYYE